MKLLGGVKSSSFLHLVGCLSLAVFLTSCTPSPTELEPESVQETWVWHNPLPFGYDLTDVYAASEHDIFAIGPRGKIIHCDGLNVREIPVPGGFRPEAIHGSGLNNIVAVGGSSALHYDGLHWQLLPVPVDYLDNLRAVWCQGIDDVFAVSPDAILHYDGQQWQAEESGLLFWFNDLHGFADGSVVAVGDGITAFRTGGVWTFVPVEGDYYLKAVWGSSRHDLYAIGRGADRIDIILHFNGLTWNQVSQPLPEGPLAITGNPRSGPIISTSCGIQWWFDQYYWEELLLWAESGRTVNALCPIPGPGIRFAAVGTSGTFLVGVRPDFFFSTDWELRVIHSGPTQSPKRLHGLQCGNLFATTTIGKDILHWNGQEWVAQETGISFGFQRIHALAPDLAFLVGPMGEISCYDGTTWTAQASGTEKDLYDVWVAGPSDAFAVGAKGLILHFDGISWQAMESPTQSYLVTVHGRAFNDVFAASWEGQILHFDGESWQIWEDNEKNYRRIWVSPDTEDLVVAIGDLCTLEHFDGLEWHCLTTGLAIPVIHDLQVNGIDSIWLATRWGIWHFGGTEWSCLAGTEDQSWSGIWANPECGIFFCDYEGIRFMAYDQAR